MIEDVFDFAEHAEIADGKLAIAFGANSAILFIGQRGQKELYADGLIPTGNYPGGQLQRRA